MNSAPDKSFAAPGERPPSAPQRARDWLGRFWAARLRGALTLREAQLFLLLAVLIGLFSGLAVVCFRIAIDWTRWVLLGSSLEPSPARALLAPSLAGLVVAFLVLHLFPRVRGSGVNQTKAAVYIYEGEIPFSTVIGKFLTCALAIGSGQSLGPEDPSLQMGAGIASWFGRRLRLSQEKAKMVAPIGAAAGLAAAFNAPVSAVLFVIEEVIGTWGGGVLGAVILAAVSSVVTMRWFLGGEPLFRVPTYRFEHPAELLSYVVLGIAGGVASLVFLKLVAALRPRLKSLPRWTQYLQPAAAGLLVGAIGLWFPQVMGTGYAYVDQALHSQYTWKLLLLLAVFKILATSFSFVSGTPGGMFAPTLFVGAMVGAAVGGLEHLLFPRVADSAAAFALVGMGTLFAGFLRTPITSVFMVVEVTGSYSIILPVMISNTIAYLISRRYQRTALFDLLSRQDGIVLPSQERLREREPLRVEQAMRAPEGWVVERGTKLIDVAHAAQPVPDKEAVLVHWPEGWKWAPMAEVRLRVSAGEGGSPIESCGGSGPVPVLFPDQTLEDGLRVIQDWPLLPVVSRADEARIEGVISLADVLATYRKSSSRRG